MMQIFAVALVGGGGVINFIFVSTLINNFQQTLL